MWMSLMAKDGYRFRIAAEVLHHRDSQRVHAPSARRRN